MLAGINVDGPLVVAGTVRCSEQSVALRHYLVRYPNELRTVFRLTAMSPAVFIDRRKASAVYNFAFHNFNSHVGLFSHVVPSKGLCSL